MQCPACQRTLKHRVSHGIELDVCEGGCGGTWFDCFELKKFDEPHEEVCEEILNLPRDESIQVDHSRRRDCPRCAGIVMRRFFFTIRREVEVDECPKCGGMWLDSGELAHIRSQFNSEEERRTAALQHFDELFGEELAQMRAESQAKRESAERIGRLFSSFRLRRLFS
jgi:uncharacterized protein